MARAAPRNPTDVLAEVDTVSNKFPNAFIAGTGGILFTLPPMIRLAPMRRSILWSVAGMAGATYYVWSKDPAHVELGMKSLKDMAKGLMGKDE